MTNQLMNLCNRDRELDQLHSLNDSRNHRDCKDYQQVTKHRISLLKKMNKTNNKFLLLILNSCKSVHKNSETGIQELLSFCIIYK